VQTLFILFATRSASLLACKRQLSLRVHVCVRGPQVPAVPRDFTVGTALRVHEVQQVTIAAKNIEEVQVITLTASVVPQVQTIRTRQVRARCVHCLLMSLRGRSSIANG
jgi:hypothetical protein